MRWKGLCADGDTLAPPRVERKTISQFRYFAANVLECGIVVALFESLSNPRSDNAHLRFLHAARGKCRRADANARRLQRRIGVVGNRILVDRDAGFAQSELGF